MRPNLKKQQEIDSANNAFACSPVSQYRDCTSGLPVTAVTKLRSSSCMLAASETTCSYTAATPSSAHSLVAGWSPHQCCQAHNKHVDAAGRCRTHAGTILSTLMWQKWVLRCPAQVMIQQRPHDVHAATAQAVQSMLGSAAVSAERTLQWHASPDRGCHELCTGGQVGLDHLQDDTTHPSSNIAAADAQHSQAATGCHAGLVSSNIEQTYRKGGQIDGVAEGHQDRGEGRSQQDGVAPPWAVEVVYAAGCDSCWDVNLGVPLPRIYAAMGARGVLRAACRLPMVPVLQLLVCCLSWQRLLLLLFLADVPLLLVSLLRASGGIAGGDALVPHCG